MCRAAAEADLALKNPNATAQDYREATKSALTTAATATGVGVGAGLAKEAIKSGMETLSPKPSEPAPERSASSSRPPKPPPPKPPSPEDLHSLAEKEAENKRLLETRPDRDSPPSSKAYVLDVDKGAPDWKEFSQKKTNAAIEKGKMLADHAHDDGGMPEMIFGRNPKQGTDGFVHRDYQKLPNDPRFGGIGNVSPATDAPINTTLHEFAHHIWEHALSPEQKEAFTKAAESSDAHKQIRASGEISDEDKEYLTRPQEHFARAYAQWVAEKTGDAQALGELDKMTRTPKTRVQHWQSKDFHSISNAIENVFTEKGWLK